MKKQKKELHDFIDRIDNPKILDNLLILVQEYVKYYSIKQTTSKD